MKIKNLIYNIIMALFIGVVLQPVTGLNQYAIAGGVMLFGQVPYLIDSGLSGGKMAFEGLQVEVWTNHVIGEIFKKNPHLKYCFRADDKVLSGKVVHIPQSGGSGNVIRNPTVFPLQVKQRIDAEVIYLLDWYAMEPMVIQDLELSELSYDKRESVLGEQMDKLAQEIGEWMLINWVTTPAYGSYAAQIIPAASIIDTTGANRAPSLSGASGTRKGGALLDMQAMKTKFQNEERWFEGKMRSMLTPEIEAEIFPADSQLTATYMRNVSDKEREAGIMYKVQGWDILTRSSVYKVAEDNTIKVPGETISGNDSAASLFWYDNTVECALGDVKPYEELNSPTMLGDTYNWATRMGGRCRRADWKGIKLLKEAVV